MPETWRYCATGTLDLPEGGAGLSDGDPVPLPLREVLGTDLPVYAVIDAARVFGLPELLEGSGLTHRCLFIDGAETDWGPVAPWLVKLERDHAFTRRMFAPAASDNSASPSWQRGTFVMLLTGLPFETVFAHLRRFLRVQTEAGLSMLLRFYDPVTFADLSQVLPQNQFAALHGPLRFLSIQSDGAWTLTEATS